MKFHQTWCALVLACAYRMLPVCFEAVVRRFGRISGHVCGPRPAFVFRQAARPARPQSGLALASQRAAWFACPGAAWRTR